MQNARSSTRAPGPPQGSAPRHQVHLLGDFHVCSEEGEIRLSADAQHLIAFLALRGSAVPRATAAGNLWTDSSQERAFGNLRSALWRVHRAKAGLVEASGPCLRIANDVEVDVDLLAERRAVLDGSDHVEPWSYRNEFLMFSHELLAGWHHEWVLVERERIRQLSLHVLELLSERLAADGRYPLAMETAAAAIRLDPLRESAHRCAIRVHLAEGNYSEALRHLDAYTSLLRSELGICPSPQLEALLHSHKIVPASNISGDPVAQPAIAYPAGASGVAWCGERTA
jgi:DNA-binding SARP family transcriptional activator